MTVQITIHCDNIQELHSHLLSMRSQLKKHSKRRKLNPLTDSLTVSSSINFEEQSAIGNRTVLINNQ
jgi:hypothetical protein